MTQYKKIFLGQKVKVWEYAIWATGIVCIYYKIFRRATKPNSTQAK